jgi:collagen type I alpha
MVQTSFSVSNATTLATVLEEISSGGTDAAVGTGYTISLTAGISAPAETLALDAGSSLTLEASTALIIDAFQVTGTLLTDLDFTGTITLDNGVLDNPAVASNAGGTFVAGRYSGVVLGTPGDGGDIAINDGSITFDGTAYAAIELDSGTIQNGWNGPESALVSGVAGGVALLTGGLVQNGGTIIASGSDTAGAFLAAGTVDNGQIGDTGALISGTQNGVEIAGAGAVDNDGTITGLASDGVYLDSGNVTNGQLGDAAALIDGGPTANGAMIATGLGTVDNFGTVIGGGVAGVRLQFGGMVANGAASDTTALISGPLDGALLVGAASLLNYGTVQANGVDETSDVIGALLAAGGTIENLAGTALIEGEQWGVAIEDAAGSVNNLGSVGASGASGLGVDLTAGGTVVNGLTTGSTATISGGFDGVRISADVPSGGALVQNDGTIVGGVGVDFESGPTPAVGTLTNDGLVESTAGPTGYAVVFGEGNERLVLQSAGTFVGNVLGGELSGSTTTLELAGGTQGTLSAPGADSGTVTDSAGSFGFSAIGTLALDAGATWTLSAPGTLDTLDNAGTLALSGGTVTVTGTMLNSGTVAIGANTLTLDAGLVSGGASTGSIVIGSGGMLTLQAGADSLQTLQFAVGGTQEMLALATPTAVLATIDNFAVGRTIDLLDTAVTGFQYSGTTLDVLDNTTTVAALNLPGPFVTNSFTHSPDLGTGTFITTDVAPCFAAGTRIATPRGEIAVDALRVGDLVETVLEGTPAPIIWIGRRQVDCAHHPKPGQVWPIRVAAGAFGPGRPHAKLFLSPDHAVYVEDVLIPIKFLINGSTITQVPVDSVTYYHIELPQHDVMLAQGLPAESFLDMRDGSNYANRSGPVRLYPNFSAGMWEAFGCARLIVTGPELTAARELLQRWAATAELEQRLPDPFEPGAVEDVAGVPPVSRRAVA